MMTAGFQPRNAIDPRLSARHALPSATERNEKYLITGCFSWQEWQGSNLRPPVLEFEGPAIIDLSTNSNPSQMLWFAWLYISSCFLASDGAISFLLTVCLPRWTVRGLGHAERQDH